MKIPSRRLVACAAAGLAAMALVTGGAARAAQPSAALKKVIARAEKEGKLNLEWGSSLLGGNEGLQAMAAGMNKMFGTKIALRFTPGPSLPAVVNKVLISIGASQPSPVDAVIGSEQHAATMIKKGAAVPIDWRAMLPQRIQPSSVEEGGRAVRVFTTMPGGIDYNTKIAPMKPTKLTDLLKPVWKGKVASTPYAASWELLTHNDVWGKRGIEFAAKLAPQLGGLIRCNDLERLASGEFAAFAMDCSGREWVKLKREGAPIAHVVPRDFPALRYYFFCIPKNAAHPDAAILFVTFLETREGQNLIWKYHDTDLNTYPGSHIEKVIDAYKKQGYKFYHFTIASNLAHPEGQVGLRKALRLLGGH